MTQHEQKPESTKFLARDASAWQPISTAPKDGTYLDLWVEGEESATRYENAHYGVEHHDCGEYGRYCDSCPAPGKRWIDAIGMEIAGTVTHWRAIPASPKDEAEQRRKDAEGADIAGYISEAALVYLTSKAPLTKANIYGSENQAWPVPLYTRPANVAALEARVKELEGEVERLKKPQWFGVDEDSYGSPHEALECLEIEPLQILEMMGFAATGLVWAFHDGKRSRRFATEADARNAVAAIREGGE
ncbi:hypothetical protein [Asaia krungthepensis]|uniref:Uncharacterized protein n=1 Tax=Asaia krungthepensis NRIC 0535 TaxID=1307925 RepID=A0ABQ0Q366_9PROT|nr:hypothetical protein [Asaia krungthepensis]GBQ89134.1 hypothetical protein AA0535_1721 [Asaia krungthepensis NRIC 0535]